MARADDQESASVNLPPELRAMLDDASQKSQSFQPAPKSHGVQQPGKLVMGIAGIPLIVLGAMLLSVNVSKNAGLKDGIAAAFLVPGAAMSGFGFYLAFQPKRK